LVDCPHVACIFALMKKIIPIIIILIGLSLLGLIVLQASWLKNLLQVKEQQVRDKINKAQSNVTKVLYAEINDVNSSKIPTSLKSYFFKNDFTTSLKQKMVSQQFSLQEVKDLLNKELANQNLQKLKYEFAILDETDNIQMFSKNFLKVYYDSSTSQTFAVPIIDIDSPRKIDDYFTNKTQKLLITVDEFKDFIWGSIFWILASSVIFSIIIFAAFYITVRTMLTQKKLSEIKSDFINNMTHEFKTPLATISLAVDAIKNEKVQKDPIKLQYFSNIIKEENKRMNTHVETILQAALLEKRELQFNIKKISANFSIASVVDNFQLQLNQKEAICNLQLNANPDIIEADELHFANVISNLIDNAIKYSKENLVIEVNTYTKHDFFYCKIEDNGIGMSKETVKNIFEKFYRAHTGNVHNVKGFGLGMSYVKTIIDSFNGNIEIQSVLGKGTTFIVQLPLAKS
jgi:two-component system, OmpR family, phosphate regulon sensor histidine kinase PhoR